MDINSSKQQPQQTNQEQPPQTDERNDDQAPKQHQDKQQKQGKSKGKVVLVAILVVILLAGAAYGSYWWRDSQAGNREAELEGDITELNEQIDNLRSQQDENEAEADDDGDSVAPSTPEAIENAVSDGSYDQIEDLLADPVNVILAASEAYGDQEPAEAVESLEYLDDATGAWDFDIPSEDLNAYRNGNYGQYFPTGAVVAESEDGYVASFGFDSQGMISFIFMASDSELLTP